MRPFVAVTTDLLPENGGFQKARVAIYANYVTALERMDLATLLVTPAHSKESVRTIVGGCGGLVISGGADIDPGRYGEEPIPELGRVSPARDAMELLALEAALELGMPVMGICRGHELLNVYFGGTLYQDIGTQVPGVITHDQTAEWGEHHHEVRVEPGSRLHAALDEEHIQINSFHHQAVKDVAPGLAVTAVAEDGLIEAIESTAHDWVVGVQWHPERYEARAPTTDPNRLLLRAFRSAIREYVNARGRAPILAMRG